MMLPKERDNCFEEKLLENFNYFFSCAFLLTRKHEDAEDLLQEAALRAFKFFKKFKPGSNFRAWFITIIRNLYINRYRKLKKRPPSVSLERIEKYVGSFSFTPFQEEVFSERMKEALDKLPEELSFCLHLFYAQGLSYKEIAKILSIPIGTVMSRLYTARNLLKKYLREAAFSKEGTKNKK